jgi:transcriptional regulator with XRE-family HTH domain
LDTIIPDINQRVKEVRTKLGLSQGDFAAGVKVSKAHISGIETKQRRATDRLLKDISITYGVNEVWLKTGEGEVFDHFDDARLRHVLENFKRLDDFLQEYILKQIDFALQIQNRMIPH